jgi:transposase
VHADEALRRMSRVFDAMYAKCGHLSVAPETLFKSTLLMALDSVRSERLFCEMLENNLLFRWLLALCIDEAAFDHSTFSKNRERLPAHRVAPRFPSMIVRIARHRGLASEQYVSVDGTLIDAWASMTSVRRNDGGHGGVGRKSGGRPQGRAAPQRYARRHVDQRVEAEQIDAALQQCIEPRQRDARRAGRRHLRAPGSCT